VKRTTLITRSLAFYWRGNVAVVCGVATAVAVLAGALLVGESVRGTLRDLAVSRLGATDVVVMAPSFFREQLAADLATDVAFPAAFDGVAPALVLEAFVTSQTTGLKAGRVRVYGVDDRFWQFHHVPRAAALGDRQALVSRGLAAEIGVKPGEPILVRVEQPSDIPLESLHGRKENHGRSIRADVASVLQEAELGEFSLTPDQGTVRAVFLPLARVQAELGLAGRVNTVLVSTRAGPGAAVLAPILRRAATLEDSGLTVHPLSDGRTLSVGSTAGLLPHPAVDAIVRAVSTERLELEAISTYVANTLRIGTREIPYSLITARSLDRLDPALPKSSPTIGSRGSAVIEGARGPASIVLNDWAARDLGARVGDTVSMDFYEWGNGRLTTRTVAFALRAIVPTNPAHRELVPSYPGITDSPTLDDWDPPFPLDLSRIRRVDEDYWKQFRTTPKAYVSAADGKRLWGSRYGDMTSVLISAPDGAPAASWQPRLEAALRRDLDPAAVGLAARDVRADALSASAGVTDFGQYFIYFSFFIVVSALVLAALFFKLGVEQRVREVGLLRAVGARAGFVRRVFLAEAGALSLVGGVVGAGGALAYAAVILWLLRTHWFDAVGTSALALHVAPLPLAAGFAGGVLAALACTWWSLSALRLISPRALLAGHASSDVVASSGAGRAGTWRLVAAGAFLGAVGLAGAGVAGRIAQSAAFFGAASLVLFAGPAALMFWYRRPVTRALRGRGWSSLARLGLRNAAAKPARSALTVSVVAAATFIVLAVDAFRKDAISDTGPKSGVGGYNLMVESLLPIAYDLNTAEGRAAANLVGVDDVRFDAFRVRPGDDTSCLNLYQPVNPRILGVRGAFVDTARFSFQQSAAITPDDRANPWRLLSRPLPDGAIPVIADANSLQYVLHKSVGDEITIDNGGIPLKLRVVAALKDSIFQGELLMAEPEFMRVFPQVEGYRFVLAQAPAARSADVAARLEDGLSTFGADVRPAADRLAEFHRVENTYLATFQTLGALGLLLGTLGLAAVLLRSVIERRRELALLGAVGYEPRHLRLMLTAESASLLAMGLLIGAIAAAVAVVPAVIERGGRVPISAAGAMLLIVILAAGTIATLLAARAAIREPILQALRSES
jgi:putative ABC transport system permease protein